MDAEKFKEIVNKSGFPLQIGLIRHIEETKSKHNWKVLFSEHSWKNEEDQMEGFIDIVLENTEQTTYMIVECKRVSEAQWLFFNQDGSTVSRRHAKVWLTTATAGSFYKDITLEPSSFESNFCVVFGDEPKNQRQMLERIAAIAVSSTEAFANEFEAYQQNQKDYLRLHVSVIVTTASLYLCGFQPDRISLNNGKIDNGEFKEVPYLRFRKQLNTRPSAVVNLSNGAHDLAKAKEQTVFVVNALNLSRFLAEFEIDGKSIRSF